MLIFFLLSLFSINFPLLPSPLILPSLFTECSFCLPVLLPVQLKLVPISSNPGTLGLGGGAAAFFPSLDLSLILPLRGRVVEWLVLGP